jgi:hypothetical protein
MTIPVEIMLRGNDRVYSHNVVQPGEPGAWSERDVAAMLKDILRAIDRIQNPDKAEQPEVALRGLSWIVHPSGDGGVVIALEIHTASAVAGPIALGHTQLETLVAKAVKVGAPASVVH